MRSESTERSHSGRSTSSRAKKLSRVSAQTSIDAKLHEDFDESDDKPNYSSSLNMNASASTTEISSYLQKIQTGKLIQPFGCLIAVNEQTLSIIAYSENAAEMLDLAPHSVPTVGRHDGISIGMDVSHLFRSHGAAALQKAARFAEINLLNPILVHCKTSGKPFYAILHRVDTGIIIDLEPVNPSDVPASAAGALKSYKLAAKAISKLQSLPSGNIALLCDVLVKEVTDLTGYDRVMIYKFHEDDHGEVVSEWHAPELEPYLGLHFPATDIPQASRFLFMRNKIRMICDCMAAPVNVVQDAGVTQPLNLSGSTLRAPHGCHAQYMANMGSIASLVMSVTINEDDDELGEEQQRGRKLWGLVVCHHSVPRFVPFPLRYACEFLIQVFGIQVNKEVEMAAQMNEKRILETQTVLCDMLLRDSPVAIMTRTPNVMDLVKCDGAALYHKKRFWLLGITPSETQLRHLIAWLNENHRDTTGLSTASLLEVGFPEAAALGDAVCGMAAIRVNSKDFLFWFRSHTAKEIKWGGAKQNANVKDEDRKMHPRSSFKAFLEVVKWQSVPWEDVEMDAIHSLRLILLGAREDNVEEDSRTIVEVPEDDRSIQKVNELRVITGEIVRLIETAAVPILAVDTSGKINGWNAKAVELTGLPVDRAIGMPYSELLERDSVRVMDAMFSKALKGQEEKNLEIKIRKFGGSGRGDCVILMVNSCCSRDINHDLVGVCFIGQDLTEQKMMMDNYTKLQGEYAGIVRNPSSLIPAIFMTDEDGRCTEWNHAMEKLSGMKRESAINRMLLGEVFTPDSYGCQVKDADTLTRLRIAQNAVIDGQEISRMLIGFYDHETRKYVEALLSANTKTNSQGRVTGALYFMCVVSPELQHALHMQKLSEQGAVNAQNKLAYIRQEVAKPLSGIILTQKLMNNTSMNEEQRQLLNASRLCQEQLGKILNDSDIESIEECYMDLNSAEFNLGDSVDAVIKQAMALSKEREVEIDYQIPREVSAMQLYGDNLRFQQALSEFLTNAIQSSYSYAGSSIDFKVTARKKRIGTTMQVVHLEFRISHPPPGVSEVVIREMFRHVEGASSEGLGLYISQKLVKIMNGTVQYLREAESSSFIVRIEFPLVNS